MHIKIHTYNFTSNYGAVLQAFSLGYYLNSLIKSEVTFSSFHPYKLKYYEFIRPLLSKKPNKVFGHFKKNIEILNWRRFYLKELSQNKDFSAKDIPNHPSSAKVFQFSSLKPRSEETRLCLFSHS